MDLALKIAIISAIAAIIGALIKLLGDLIVKGSSGGRVFTVIIVILALLGGGAFVLFLQTPTSQTFSGTWQGVDAYDGSIMTMSLIQNESQLQGNLSDTFTKHPDATTLPGAAGPGSGKVVSTTEAEMTFLLTRSNGESFLFKVKFQLSDSNTIILEDSTILLRQ